MSRIDTYDKLAGVLDAADIIIDEEARKWFDKKKFKATEYLPFLTTSYYLETAVSADADGRAAILKQIIPDIREFEVKDYELADPLGEERFSPFDRFVHRYPDRALILVTDRCAMYCRHCFRRSFSGGMKGPLSNTELAPMLAYLSLHSEISEVLLTGGDPLTLSDDRLLSLIRQIKAERPEMIIRLCSRMPVVNPARITEALTLALSEYDGIWFITHFNHPAELSQKAAAAVRRLVKKGVPVLNQTVLLKGVNDSLGILKDLSTKLLQAGIKPYYLFQGDLAAGTSHLRLPLNEALELTAALKDRVSGMAMPRFAVDLPGGGGKITLPSESHPIEKSGDYYVIKGLDNEEYRYPAN